MRTRPFPYLRAACLAACLAAPAHAQDTTFGDQGFAFAAFSDLLHDFSEIQAMAVQSDGKIVVVGHAQTAAGDVSDTAFAVARFTAAGALDTSFVNSAGRTMIGFEGLDFAVGVGVQGDGKIVVAGLTFASTAYGAPKSIALARLTPGGQLDVTFGTSGRATAAIGAFANVKAMALRPDGRILVAGNLSRPDVGLDFLFVQFRSNGTLDTSFGTNGPFPNLSGAITVDLGGHDSVSALAIQSDGRVVAAGSLWLSSTDQRFALARLTANGVLDSSFGTSGKVVTSFANAASGANGVAVQADGRIVAVGVAQSLTASAPTNVAVARYLANGALDTGFSGDGRVMVAFAPSDPARFDTAHAVAIQPDGRIVTAGSTGRDDASVFALARLTATGTLDTSFGSDGRIVTDRRGHRARAIATQAFAFDVRVVVAGEGGPIGSSTRFAVARFFGFPRAILPPNPGPFD
jgi:uncharacterized delta-60 repeat protein